jgi:hypothetical protein
MSTCYSPTLTLGSNLAFAFLMELEHA